MSCVYAKFNAVPKTPLTSLPLPSFFLSDTRACSIWTFHPCSLHDPLASRSPPSPTLSRLERKYCVFATSLLLLLEVRSESTEQQHSPPPFKHYVSNNKARQDKTIQYRPSTITEVKNPHDVRLPFTAKKNKFVWNQKNFPPIRSSSIRFLPRSPHFRNKSLPWFLLRPRHFLLRIDPNVRLHLSLPISSLCNRSTLIPRSRRGRSSAEKFSWTKPNR